MAVLFLAKISALKTYKKSFNNHGLTLLEVMIVVAIIAAVVAIAIPEIGNNNGKLKAFVQRLTVLSRQVHTNAKLKNATYRIVFDLGIENDPDRKFKYWVEKSSQVSLIPEAGFIDLNKEKEPDEEEDSSSNGFERDEKVIKESELPSGMKVSYIELANEKEPFTQGKVYIYYFPQGLVSETAIHLSAGEKLKWTVAIHPITGYADIITKEVKLEDLRRQ